MNSVLIFTLNLNAGGAENQLIKIAKLLVNNGRKVAFLVYKKEGTHLAELNDLGISIQSLPKINYIVDAYRLAKIVKKNSVDCVLSFLPPCNLVNELSKLLYTKHKVVVGARSSKPSFRKAFRYKIFYWAHSLADCVISNTEMNKKDIITVNKRMTSGKIRVIYNLTDSTLPHSQYIPFASNRINIVVAANYRKVKNVDGLISAISLLTDKEKEKVKVDWYGLDCGEKGGAIDCLIKVDLKDVVFLHDSTTTIIDEMNKADVIALFSHYEGLPNSLCEALVIGKMIICTPVSDMPYLLKDSGNIVCASDRAEDIKQGLTSLIEKEKDSILEVGRRNREKYSSLFVNENIEEQLLSIF